MRSKIKTSVLAITLLAGACLLAAGVPSANGGWLQVGSPGFSTGAASGVKIALDSSEMPYVAYNDAGSNKGYVAAWNGISWQVMGGVAFSAGAAFSINLAIDSINNVYVGYQDSANNNTYVNIFSSGAWNILLMRMAAAAIKPA